MSASGDDSHWLVRREKPLSGPCREKPDPVGLCMSGEASHQAMGAIYVGRAHQWEASLLMGGGSLPSGEKPPVGLLGRSLPSVYIRETSRHSMGEGSCRSMLEKPPVGLCWRSLPLVYSMWEKPQFHQFMWEKPPVSLWGRSLLSVYEGVATRRSMGKKPPVGL